MDIYATELMGAKTYDAAGNYVGRVREFFIEPAEASNRVSHYLLSRGHFQPLVAKHDQVASVAAGKMELSVSERALELYSPNESWLAVQKDLLDQQIIDTRGRFARTATSSCVWRRWMWESLEPCGGCSKEWCLPRWFASCRANCHNAPFAGNL